jgi:hypothetical protein
MIIRDLTYQGIKMPVCLFGGISVHPNYRGKGVFKFFMNNIITRFEKDCGLFMLWSGDPSLYLKFGFHLTGEQFETIATNSEDIQLFTKTKLINLASKEIEQIGKIYKNIISKNFLTFDREYNDWANLKNITSADLYIKKNSSGEIDEYFIVHKGEDLVNIVYENSFILTEKHYSLAPFKIWSPVKSKNPTKDNTHYTCMTRLGSSQYFNSFIQQISLNMINIIEYNIEKNYISFYFKGDKITTGINDFLCGLLGPGQFEEIKLFLPKLYISGLDSI